MMEEQNESHTDRYFPMPEEQRPDAWQLTPRLRWKRYRQQPHEFQVAGITVGTVTPQQYYVLQQLWHIPNSEQRDWRDVPTVREEQG